MRRESKPGRPIRVLVVAESLSHYRYDVYRNLENSPGLDVEFAAGPRSRDGSVAVIPTSMLNTVHVVQNRSFGGFYWQSGLFGVVRRNHPDVVIYFGDSRFISTWLSGAFQRICGRGVLFWTIGWGRPEGGIQRLYRLAFYRIANRLLLYGNVGMRVGIAMGYPSDRMTVIYNSISEPYVRALSPDALDQLSARLPSGEYPVVTAVVRLNAKKRLDLLIEAAAILEKSGCHVSVLLVGDGPDRGRIERLSRSLNVAVYCLGPAYSSAELKLVYDRTTVTVVPSYAGLTTIQSLNYGVPVITHNFEYEQVPESEAIEPGVTGSVYDHGDAQSLARAIVHWIARQANHREFTASRCREAVAAQWSPAAQRDKIVHEVRELASSNRIGSIARRGV